METETSSACSRNEYGWIRAQRTPAGNLALYLELLTAGDSLSARPSHAGHAIAKRNAIKCVFVYASATRALIMHDY